MNESFENAAENTTGTQSGLTRRQVALGAAWAAPVVALAVATPLAAASGGIPRAWQVNSSISGSGGPQYAGNISITGGGVTLLNNPGDSTGLLTITVNVPVNYTAQRSDTDATAIAQGTIIDGWTVTLFSVSGSNGRTAIVFSHPGATIPVGQTSVNVPFSGFFLRLAAGQNGAPIGDSATTLTSARIRVSSSVDGPDSDSFFPALPEE
ncbi:MAG: hypothetical protein Q7T71_01955 [Herbiconiux sp.]|nr:hypothetical protein [Herbiconiux sp.]